jgi:hypothetical protein
MSSKTSKTTDPQRYLLVVEDHSHGYYRLHGQIVTQRYEGSQWLPYGTDDTYGDGYLWSGLRSSCQGDESSMKRDREPVYGFDVEYHDVWSIDVRKCRRMIKTLERINKGLHKLAEQRGAVGSYGEYCGRLCEVIGCVGIAMKRDPKYDYSQTYSWSSTIGDGVNDVNNAIWRWRQPWREQQEREQEAAAGRQLQAEEQGA